MIEVTKAQFISGTGLVVGQKYRIKHSDKVYEVKEFYRTLEVVKAEKIAQIKEQAFARITAFNWMLERDKRHEALGKPKKKSLAEIYQLQQDIEDASDAAEIAVNALVTIEDVRAFVW